MNKDRELWQFIQDRIGRNQHVMLLVVVESSGSSPGRPSYKMAVGSDGEITGSIGGGVMEVNLVERSRKLLSEPPASAGGQLDFKAQLVEQVHQKNSLHASGMICSGRQTVILVPLAPKDSRIVDAATDAIDSRDRAYLKISQNGLTIDTQADVGFDKRTDTAFTYAEQLGHRHELYIIGGGHCALALSELMSKLDFRITIFDDRPELNTIEKNHFAHEIWIIEGYESVGELLPAGADVYVVVMTLGYASDEIAIRSLVKKDTKYLGVLGSKAKMKVLLKTLEKEGVEPALLSRIRTPIGLPINSHSPEEIAVSIAAEIISIKNA